MKTYIQLSSDGCLDLMIEGTAVMLENMNRGSETTKCEVLCRICSDGLVFVDKPWLRRNQNLRKRTRTFLLAHERIWQDQYPQTHKKLNIVRNNQLLLETLCEFPGFTM